MNEWFFIPRGDGTYMRTRVKRNGVFVTDPPMQKGATNIFLEAINHPETIIRSPKAAKPLFEIARLLGASYVSRDGNVDNPSYDFWEVQPKLGSNKAVYVDGRPKHCLPTAALYFRGENTDCDPHWLAPGKCAFVGRVTDGTPSAADTEQK